MSTAFKHLAQTVSPDSAPGRGVLSRDEATPPGAVPTEIVELRPGDLFHLRAAPVSKRIGDATVRMFGYNKSIPGPTLKVSQGSKVTVEFTNEIDIETTVHWHGLRLDNRFDGVPEGAHRGMQPPVPVGGSYSYRLSFPDPGVYWYHPHIREDYTQEMGLYGNIIVVPGDPEYWPPVNREFALTLDDILLDQDGVVDPRYTRFTPAVMARLGNPMLLNGETSGSITAARGEVIRLYLTNTANYHNFLIGIPGAQVKLVGGDLGRVEREQFVEEIMLSPSERAIVDVLFESAGRFSIEHRDPDRNLALGAVEVAEEQVERSFAPTFFTLRHSEELRLERAKIDPDFDRVPDKILALAGQMAGGDHGGHHAGHGGGHAGHEGVAWKLIDRATNRANHDIYWSFRVGDRVKIRIANDPHSEHPMAHPVHFHGQRFLVLSRNGIRNDNLVWKDTVLVGTGEMVDILLDATNPGVWMVHCHIAEHLESGMMFSFEVLQEAQKREHAHGHAA